MLPKRRRIEVEEDKTGSSMTKPRSSLVVGGNSPTMIVENSLSNSNSNSHMKDVEIDEDLHSRQLAVYGRETMRRLFGANILVSGLGGLGVEVAKNTILAGVKSVTLHDRHAVEIADLSSQFYLSEADIGRNRAEACADRLMELNTTVAVAVHTGEVSEGFLSNFHVVVFTDLPMDKAIQINSFCHTHQPPIAFIKAEIRGVFASVFCDFGPEFTVMDTDGEEPHTGIVASIGNGNPALVTCVDDERLEFQDGEFVTFREVKGMLQLNDGKPRRVKNVKAHSFHLEEDTTKYNAYEGGGIVTQVKEQKVLKFKPLHEALSDPGEFLLSDFSKFDRPALLYVGFQALSRFESLFGRLPQLASCEDAENLVALAKEVNEKSGDRKLESLDEDILRKLSFGAAASLSPMAALFGGIVGQEAVKACSGKFHPIFQFFYFDSVESLPPKELPVEETMPAGSRYDPQIALFGRTLQEKMMNANCFMVGAGALGCEFLKNLALMGFCCGDKGKLTLTDDDTIEKSNLSRQFLFRDWNIGQSKSLVAAAAATVINPGLRVNPLQNRVSPETETVFNDEFWDSLDVVINALDNVNARLYVDSRCVYFQKPLLESGTLGTKCNTQMVIPHQTENYGASRDPPEKQAPMCTLHSFPHNIDHCLVWARSEFEGFLEKTPSEVNAFLAKPAEYKEAMKSSGDAQARDALERIVECLVSDWCETFEHCIAWARRRFEEYFANRVKQLTFTFPENAVTSTGAPFWSAPKRFPMPLVFSSKDPCHISFVIAGAILRAETFGIARPGWATDMKKVAEVVDQVPMQPFVAKQGLEIVTDERATSTVSPHSDDESIINALLQKLVDGTKNIRPGFQMHPVQFEKDDDTNFHMDFIVGLANMRARNYSIPEVDKLKAKLIAGRIIPAIATTTALATGFVCLELYKVLQSQPAERHRNTFANLALPLFAMAEPVSARKFKHGELEWSVWDRWVIEGDVTLRQVLDWFRQRNLNAYSISCGQSLLYNNIFPRHRERMDRKVSELAKEIAKLEVPTERRHFDIVVACEDDESEDLDVPLVSIRFR